MSKCDLCGQPTDNKPAECCGSVTCNTCKIMGCFCENTVDEDQLIEVVNDGGVEEVARKEDL